MPDPHPDSPADLAPDPRLARQVRFLLELDRVKHVLRRNRLADGSRRENDAEHSWHLAVAGLVLREHAPPGVDLERVLVMLLLHDVVEIDAGDTFVYDAVANAGRVERERRAAERIYGLLPPDQAEALRTLWEEFEARATPEARFAAALDRLLPLLLNHANGGVGWREHRVRQRQVREVTRPLAEIAPALAEMAERLIADAVARGYLDPA